MPWRRSCRCPADRIGKDRRTGGRAPRCRRQPLLRHARWTHRAVFGAGLHADADVLAKIGGRPLGLAFDAQGRIVTCVAGMGLVRVTLSGEVELLTDQTERSLFSIQDDTTIRMADDLDIAADGTIYFTDATKRYDIADWGLDLLEGRPNGRLLSFEPKSRKTRTVCDNLIFPNGVCLTHDGHHLLVASTWTCSILIFDLRNLSDGPADFRPRPARLSRQHQPRLRRRLLDRARRHAQSGDGRGDDACPDCAAAWPNACRRPTGCSAISISAACSRSTAAGHIRDALWDKPDGPLYMITSMREHKGALYLGRRDQQQNRPSRP